MKYKMLISRLIKIGAFLLIAISVKSQAPKAGAVVTPGTKGVNPTPSDYPANPEASPIVNMICEWDPTYADTVTSDVVNTGRTLQEVKLTSQYFDGLGRPIQTTARKMGGNQSDIVSSTIYDASGREVYKYLPYVATTNDGSFQTNAFSAQNTFMQGYAPASGEKYYYSQTDYEASPLNRATKTYAPGNSWVGTGNGVSQDYTMNTTDDQVHIWNISLTTGSIPTDGGIYQNGSLFKTSTADENGNQVIEFKDQAGHVILKKVALATSHNDQYNNWLCTYYVYDDLGHLRFVMQPKAVDYLSTNGWVFDGSAPNWTTSTIAQGYCFGYEYDGRHRLIIKHVPDGGETDMVYDSRDRLIMTQDANQEATGKWLVTVYDGLNRMTQKGLLNDGNPRAYHANHVGMNLSYPPVTTGFELLTQTYYDNYQWITDNSVSLKTTLIPTNLTNPQYFLTIDPNNQVFPYQQAIQAVYQNNNMVTGTKTEVLGSNPVQYLYAVNFYDDHGRLIQTQSMNYSNPGSVVRDTVTTQYSFSGQVLRTLIAHKKGGTKSQNYRVATNNNYDPAGRLINIFKTIGNQFKAGNSVRITQNNYDQLGQLIEKDLGQQVDPLAQSYSYFNPIVPVDVLNYSYNIRGWLRGINKDYARAEGSSSSWFGMELCYDYGFTNTSPVLNGNISGERWRSKGDGEQRAYGFTYDGANRLTNADYNQLTGTTWDKSKTDFTTSNLTYDLNGNILTMNQMGVNLNTILQLDQLQYGYVSNSNHVNISNRLDHVFDNSTAGWNSTLGDFKEITHDASQDYTYDNNGNLKTDNNKAISGITYNYLNLPSVITTGKGTITYSYDATGNKLLKVTDEPQSAANNYTHMVTSTSYFGPFEYVRTDVTPNGGSTTVSGPLLQYISTEEGRARPSTPGSVDTIYYDYFEKDHLGNVRVVLTDQHKQDIYPVADVESSNTAALNIEKEYYDIQDGNIVDNSSVTNFTNNNANIYPNNNPGIYNNNPSAHAGDNSTKLYKVAAGGNTGLGVTLRVMSGDVVDIFGKSYYHSNNQALNNTSSIGSVTLLNLITNFAGSNPVQALHGGLTSSQLEFNPGTSDGAINWLNGVPTPVSTTVPKAYINWVLLDDRFQVVNSGCGFDLVNTVPDIVKAHHKTVTIPANGYLYVYCSNQSNIDVFFDNLQVIQTHGPLVEETHYYPFGLTMAGISSQALNFGQPENNRLYNKGSELQHHEFSDGSGLELYATNLRSLDPQLGRWWQIDPKPDYSESLYSAISNNPILHNDPLGDTAWPIQNQWNAKFVRQFRRELNGSLRALNNSNQTFTCDDLALQTIVSFASKHNLPFKWTTGSGTFNAADDKYTNTNDFLLDVKKHSGAPDFANNANTTTVDAQNIQSGTLNVLTAKGKDNPNHIQVISSVISGGVPSMTNGFSGGVQGYIAAQGNFKGGILGGRLLGSDNPTSSRYLGVHIQSGVYDVKSNTWTSPQTGTTTNFIGEHYSSEYRDFNFSNFNEQP
jgi:RHS repeat-associated protein